ncbi:2-C-methyl-D-erythritol 2,4-cyclodiphosphate synthase [bacterium HR29]|jgi:2-C-methyl-D-erythritol 2,4-cyclodiphosphate synthase|nr:2-C-methyl-D-erythritol 2,4-cyclodiphosphate synthase [bacterium HR29]
MMRVGFGSDIHRVDDNRPLVLGGVIIEEGPGLAGHSDADVLLHALTDAILGAAALGDIGQHFPPSDPRWAHADSADFVRKAVKLAAERGWRVANVDAVVRAERPRLAPYIPLIRERIASVLGVSLEAVSVKAKTAEGLDAVGRGEAMAAEAICLLERSR